jgi:hypothetical protein
MVGGMVSGLAGIRPVLKDYSATLSARTEHSLFSVPQTCGEG